jgi:beta-1,4-mannosyltransferase
VEGRIRTAEQRRGDVTAEALQALRMLPPGGHEALLLGYHPVARMNPYQALLYREAWGASIAPVRVVREDGIEELADFARRGIPALLHLHWLGGPLRAASSAPEAAEATRRFLARLDGFRDAGGRLAWTVHNVLPHDTRFEAEEAALRAGVVDRADVVHVLAASTAAQVAPWFRIPPERILHVPHSSYAGAYADHVGREQAREELGLLRDELVYLLAGAIRPYKGLTGLLDAWDRLAPDVPRRLVIAGPPGDDPGIAALVERAVLMPTVLVHARRIPSDQMQLFCRAADVAVLPYVRSLNSGALMLALTFGLPVIVPAAGGLAEAVDEPFARTFDPDVPSSLDEALLRAPEIATAAGRAAAAAAGAALDPIELSRRFAEGLRAMLDH